MALSKLSTEAKIDALRFLHCSDITTVSLVNKSFLILIEANPQTLPKRAIDIFYEQINVGHTDERDFDGGSLSLLREIAAQCSQDFIVGTLKIVEIGTGRKLFHAFPVEEDRFHRIVDPADYLPIKAKDVLRSILVDDANLVVINRLSLFTNSPMVPLMADLMDFLTTPLIKVPIGVMSAESVCSSTSDNLWLARVREKRRILHFKYTLCQFFTDHELSNSMYLCARLAGKTTFCIEKWCCGEEALMKQILSEQYDNDCRMLARMNSNSLAWVRRALQFLYSTFNSDNVKLEISIPPSGVWLEFTNVTPEMVPAGFWSEVFDGLAPVEVGQPLLVPHDEKEAEEGERYVCDVYELRAPNRKKAMRVFVAHDDPKRGEGLLIHLKWE